MFWRSEETCHPSEKSSVKDDVKNSQRIRKTTVWTFQAINKGNLTQENLYMA